MRGWVSRAPGLWLALGLAACTAQPQPRMVAGIPVARDAVVSTAMAAPPSGDTTRLRQVGAEVLFWDAATRDRNFRAMETVFPGYVVKGGEAPWRTLPPGAPLPIDAAAVDAYVAANDVAGLIVIQDGKVRLERHARGLSANDRWTSFSVAKSFTSTLVGAAIRDGHIRSVDDPVTRYIPELVGSGYDGVTIRQLLTMTSGVRWNEDYTDPQSDVARMYANAVPPGDDATIAYMRTLPRETPPGAKFVYKTGETNLVGVLVAKAIGDRSIATYMSERLWNAAGFQGDAFWMIDAGGREAAGCCLSMTLHNYARMGLFALEEGRIASGPSPVPDGWFAEATRAHVSFPTPGFGYGYQWWTFPGGRYGAQGIFGQAIFVDPARRLVIAQVANWPRATDRTLTAARLAFFDRLSAAADGN